MRNSSLASDWLRKHFSPPIKEQSKQIKTKAIPEYFRHSLTSVKCDGCIIVDFLFVFLLLNRRIISNLVGFRSSFSASSASWSNGGSVDVGDSSSTAFISTVWKSGKEELANFQDLVAKVKNLGALAPVLGAISRPVKISRVFCIGFHYNAC